MLIQRTLWLGIFVVGAMSFSSCNEQIGNLSGAYTGDYSRIENGVVQAYRVTTTIADKTTETGVLTFTLKDNDTQKDLGSVEIDKSGSTYTLKSALLEGSKEVPLKNLGPCADEVPSQEGQRSRTTVCVQADTVSLFSTDATGNRVLIYLNKNAADPQPVTVKNGEYALNDLFQAVLTRSYTTRIATENLYQASEAAKVARAGLYPVLSASAIVALVAAPLSATTMMGQLVPFVFTAAWYAFHAATYTYESQVISYKTLIANQMSLAEDLYHDTLRDTLLAKKLQDLAVSLQARRDMVALRVQLGYVPDSDLTAMDDLIYRSNTSIGALQTALTTEYASLSIGIGLSARNGIQSLNEMQALDFTALKPLDSSSLMAEAKSGSLDIRQMMYLEAAAASNVKQQEWSVVNASAWVSLDESIIHKVEISKSNLKEVHMQQGQTEQSVEENVISLTALYNQLLAQNIALTAQVAAHKKSLDTVTAQYQSGEVSMLVYREAIESMIQLEADQITAQSQFAAAQGKINRLLWQGSYLDALQMEIPKTFL